MFRKYIILVKLRWVLMGLALLFSFNSAYASVIINEVQLSPTGERFLELYNTSDSAIDLTGWYMQRKTATGSTFGSLVSNPNFEGKTIGAQNYFVISRVSLNSSDIVLDNLTLTESNTIQIKNSEGEVIDKIGWGEVSDCPNSCPSNPPEGQSLQLVSGSWITSTPTPGQANKSSSSSSNNNTGSSNTTTSENSTTLESKPKTTTSPTMKAKIVASNLTFTGQPFRMKADISGFSNENVLLGRVYWNFGDGVSLEQVNNFEKFYHIYHYPGDYVVLVEYYQNNFSEIPDATAKMIIKVIPITVTISKVGDVNDFFIELSNNASSDIDVSSWVINANGKTFSLPKNSVIMSKKQMTISGKVTGFTHGDQFNLKLFSSTGGLVFDYAPPSTRQDLVRATSVPAIQPFCVPPCQGGDLLPPLTRGGQEGLNEMTDASNLQATAIASDSIKNSSNNSFIPIMASFIFIGASAGAVYFIRQRRNPLKVGDDFKILDE